MSTVPQHQQHQESSTHCTKKKDHVDQEDEKDEDDLEETSIAEYDRENQRHHGPPSLESGDQDLSCSRVAQDDDLDAADDCKEEDEEEDAIVQDG